MKKISVFILLVTLALSAQSTFAAIFTKDPVPGQCEDTMSPDQCMASGNNIRGGMFTYCSANVRNGQGCYAVIPDQKGNKVCSMVSFNASCGCNIATLAQWGICDAKQ